MGWQSVNARLFAISVVLLSYAAQNNTNLPEPDRHFHVLRDIYQRVLYLIPQHRVNSYNVVCAVGGRKIPDGCIC